MNDRGWFPKDSVIRTNDGNCSGTCTLTTSRNIGGVDEITYSAEAFNIKSLADDTT